MEQTLAPSNSGQLLNNNPDSFHPSTDDHNDQNSPSETQHKLHSSWTIWYMNGDTRSAPAMGWDQMLQPLATFDTIEKFWNIYHRLCPPSKMKVKNDYMLFREGIKPQWEDVSNKAGGSWKMVLPSKHRGALLDRIWLETVFSLIGRYFFGGSVAGSSSGIGIIHLITVVYHKVRLSVVCSLSISKFCNQTLEFHDTYQNHMILHF